MRKISLLFFIIDNKVSFGEISEITVKEIVCFIFIIFRKKSKFHLHFIYFYCIILNVWHALMCEVADTPG